MAVRGARQSVSGDWTLGGGLRGRHAEEPESGPELAVLEGGAGAGGGDGGDRSFPSKRGLLSKAEIEMLLRPDLSDMDDADQTVAPEATAIAEDASPTRYPDRDSLDLVLFDGDSDADDIGELEVITTRMLAALRRDAQLPLVLELASVGGNPDVSGGDMVHAVFETRDGDPAASLSMPQDLVSAILNHLCGQADVPGPAKSTIQLGAAGRAVLIEALAPLASALGSRIGEDVALRRIETDHRVARLVQTGLHRDVFSLKAQCVGLRSRIVVSISPRTRDALSPDHHAHGARDLPDHLETRLFARIASLAVPISKVGALAPGQTLLLGVPADQPVELVTRLGGASRPVADGRLGRYGGKIAVKLTRRLR